MRILAPSRLYTEFKDATISQTNSSLGLMGKLSADSGSTEAQASAFEGTERGA